MNVRVVSLVALALGFSVLTGCESDARPPSAAVAEDFDRPSPPRRESTDGGAAQSPSLTASGERDETEGDAGLQVFGAPQTMSETASSTAEPEYVPPTADFAKGIDASAGEAIRGGLDGTTAMDAGPADAGVRADSGLVGDAAAVVN